jgi:putative two-component system response regulator
MSILVIDDEAGLRRSLCAYLEDRDHDMLEAANGSEGLDVLDKNIQSVEAVIVDLNMPVMDGYSFIQAAVTRSKELPLIVLSGVGIVEDALRAMRLGAWDFITKPLHNFAILDYTLEKVFDKARLIRENRLYQTNLENLVRERTKELEHALAELDRSQREAIQHLSAAAEYKDEDTGLHIQRMSNYSALIAARLGLDPDEVNLILTSSPMHDVGKIGIPDDILLKPGKLDPDEWKIMKEHANIGGRILGAGNSDYMNMGTIIALSHHEKWDGSGYPSGLAGEDIPLPGRICAVADVFDALISKRPYKEAFPLDKALAIMKESRGSHFDPKLLDVFLESIDEVVEIIDKFKEK